MKGTSFDDIKDVQKVSANFLKTIKKADFKHCFEKLNDCCNKCIEEEGMYFG